MTTSAPLALHPPAHGPEEDFVLRCAKALTGTAEHVSTESGPGECRAGLDGQRVWSIASEHRVVPSLEFATAQSWPGTMETVRWNLLLSSELLRLIALFHRHLIPAMPFKGPVMASVLYGDPAMRQSCDLDILVRPRDLERVCALLSKECCASDLPTDPGQRAAYLRTRYEVHFTSPKNAISIEIHQSFLARSYSLGFDYEKLWGRAEVISFFGQNTLSLAPGDLLLVLCVHAAKHSWAELVYLCDIARLLVTRSGDLLWSEILREAHLMGASRILRIGLLLASDLLDAPLPAEIEDDARRDARALAIAGEALLRLFRQAPSASSFPQYLLFLRARERFRDSVLSVAGSILSPNEEDYSLLKLPAFLASLYIPIHAMRVTVKYALSMMRNTVRWAAARA